MQGKMRPEILLWNLALVILIDNIEFTAAQADPELRLLVDDFWHWKNTEFPALNNPQSSMLESFSFDRFKYRTNITQGFLTRTKSFDRESLSSEDKLTLKLLEYQFSTFTEGYKWVDYGTLNPINMLEGGHMLSHLWADRGVYNTFDEYMLYIAKLNKVPNQIEEVRTLLLRAVQFRRTNHNVSMKGVLDQIDAVANEDPTASIYYKQFQRMEGSIAFSYDDKQTLKNRGVKAIQRIQVEFKRLGDWMQHEYMVNTRKHEGVWSFHDGAEYYKSVLKWHLSLDMHPETVHQIGQREVIRIKKKMQNVMSWLGFSGDLEHFLAHLKSEKTFYNHTQEQYLKLYEDAIFNRIQPRMSLFFPNLHIIPNLTISQAPRGSLAASYWYPNIQVNTHSPETRSNFTVLTIALHEGLPGHHLQVSYMRNLALPDFRRYFDAIKKYAVPFSFPYYTAYVEGWGLYAEYMGEEMGLFDNPYELFGRYTYEIFRACRLVVDTGIHYKGWTRSQSLQYLKRYTLMSTELLEREVDRYITWPGQACSYKIGELKFKELREKAEGELGYKFNVVEFHDEVLKYGAVPLDILEDIVNEWITKRKELSLTSDSPRITSNNNWIWLFLHIYAIFNFLVIT